MERIPYDELAKLAQDWSIDLSQWQLSGRSLLNRDSQGNYKFAHRSIMEFLFVNRIIQGDSDCSGIILSDQMKSFLIEQIVPESISLDLKEAFEFLSGNEVFVTYVDSNGASCAEGNSLDQTTISLGSIHHTTEIEAFLENLDYTSRYLYRLSQTFAFGPFQSSVKENEGLQATKIFELVAEADAYLYPLKVSGYVREIIKLVSPIEPEYEIAIDTDYRISGMTLVKHLAKEMYNNLSSIDIRDISSQSPGDVVRYFQSVADDELRNIRQPETVHPDVRRFIELHGLLGLISYYQINSSELCSIRPKLPRLDQFELILMPRQF
jgi:hypothetical protein